MNDLTLKELREFKTKKDNQDVPTFEEVLQLCKGKIFINIELKDGQIKETFKEVTSLLEKYEMFNQIAISSFKHEYYEEIKTYPKKIEFGFLYHEKGHKEYKPINFNVNDCSMNIHIQDMNEEMVNKIHEKGLAAMCWCPMKQKEDDQLYEKLFKMGVDILCCNEPNKAILCRNKFFGLNK